MRATIGSRLAITVAVAVTVSAVVTSGVSVRQELDRYVQARRDVLLATGSAFAAAIGHPLAAGDQDGVFAALRGIGGVKHLTSATARNASGVVLGQSGSGVRLDRDPRLGTDDAVSVWDLLLSRSITVGVPVRDAGNEVGTLELVGDADDLWDGLLAVLGANLAGAGVALLGGLIVAARLQRSITRPLTRLTAAMRQVQDRHDYAVALPAAAGDEVGSLITGFGAMLSDIRARDEQLVRHRDRLEQDVEDRTRDLRRATDAAEQANMAKSTFLATMSHEIRTPMTGLLVMAELLASGDLPARSRRYAEVISKSGSALLAIINDILDFSKIEAGKLETEQVPVDVRDVVATVVSLFYARAREKGLDLAATVAAAVPLRVRGDPVRLQQVVSNLVNNALKFTQAGSVTVAVSLEEDGRLSLAVIDTGIGIAEDKLDRIFEAFSQADDTTTRQFGGTGLGLAISNRLAAAMGGRIDVRSQPGEGSTFTCLLPLETLEAAPPWPRPALETNRAVVAVAAPATARAIAAALRQAGFKTSLTRDPAAAAVASLLVADEAALARGVPRSGPGLVIGVAEPGEAGLDRLSARPDLVLRLPFLEGDLRSALQRVARGEPLAERSAIGPSATAADGFAGAKILVVDDTAVNREVMVEALRRFGLVPDLAVNGLEALAATARTAYDLVFMDGSMPELDGFEACRRLRLREAGARRTPVVALTAHVVGVAADAWREAGMDGVLHKPFTLAELERVLATSLTRRPAPPEAAAATLFGTGPDPAAEPDAEPLLDQGVLAEITAMSEDSGGAFAQRVFALFTKHAPKAVQALTRALSEADHDGVASAAHALKSMSLNIGARRVGSRAGLIEAAARTGAVEPRDVAALRQVMDETVQALTTRLTGLERIPAAAAP